jgi:hypothetical protein
MAAPAAPSARGDADHVEFGRRSGPQRITPLSEFEGGDGDGYDRGAALSVAREMPFDEEEAMGASGVSAGDARASFSLRASSARPLWSAVSAVYSHKREQFCTLAVNAKGLRVICGNIAKSLHGVAYISRVLFDEFTIEGTEVALRVRDTAPRAPPCVHA